MVAFRVFLHSFTFGVITKEYYFCIMTDKRGVNFAICELN